MTHSTLHALQHRCSCLALLTALLLGAVTTYAQKKQTPRPIVGYTDYTIYVDSTSLDQCASAANINDLADGKPNLSSVFTFKGNTKYDAVTKTYTGGSTFTSNVCTTHDLLIELPGDGMKVQEILLQLNKKGNFFKEKPTEYYARPYMSYQGDKTGISYDPTELINNYVDSIKGYHEVSGYGTPQSYMTTDYEKVYWPFYIQGFTKHDIESGKSIPASSDASHDPNISRIPQTYYSQDGTKHQFVLPVNTYRRACIEFHNDSTTLFVTGLNGYNKNIDGQTHLNISHPSLTSSATSSRRCSWPPTAATSPRSRSRPISTSTTMTMTTMAVPTPRFVWGDAWSDVTGW